MATVPPWSRVAVVGHGHPPAGYGARRHAVNQSYEKATFNRSQDLNGGGRSAARSLHFFKVARLPGAVKDWLLGAVNAEVGEPPLAWDRLNPPTFLAGRSLRAEVQVDGFRVAGVLQREQRSQLRLVLRGLDLRTGGRVVDGDGPEQDARHRKWDGQLVRLAAVDECPGRVPVPEPVERACSSGAAKHRGRRHDGLCEPTVAGLQVDSTLRLELDALRHEGCPFPLPVLPRQSVRARAGERGHEHLVAARSRRFLQDALHAGVRREGLTLLDA